MGTGGFKPPTPETPLEAKGKRGSREGKRRGKGEERMEMEGEGGSPLDSKPASAGDCIRESAI